jgi:hypothetical protein
MRRRKFITLLGGAVASPVAARAQQSAMPIAGFFNHGSPESSAHLVAAYLADDCAFVRRAFS